MRGPAALKSAALTIEYEYRMLLVGFLAWGRAPTTEERNLVLEAFLVHTRNLRDFFAKSGQSDDILARDFVSQMPRIAMPYLRSKPFRKRLNRKLAHLSYSRPRLTSGWERETICREIEVAMRRFLERLQEENPRRVPWFGDVPGILAPLGTVATLAEELEA